MSDHRLLSRLPLRAARWSATHPWRAIGAWFVFVIAATSLAVVVHTQQTTDADYRLGDSGRAAAMTAAARLTHGQVESILVTPAGGGALDPAGQTASPASCGAQAADLPGVTRVAPAQLSPDGTSLLVDVHLRDSVDDVTALAGGDRRRRGGASRPVGPRGR